MKNVLITGASGLIGGRLTQEFLQAGFQVAHLGRKPNASKSARVYGWDIDAQKIDPEAVLDKQIIVSLAGTPVADKRWTDARKKEIIDSRVKSTELLVRSILALENKPEVFVAASAVGYYGMVTTEQIFTEDAAPSTDFFGQCCSAWEAALKPLQDAGVRVVILRIGVVLAKEGGALPKLAGPVKAYIGSPLGSGKQWVPWIHLSDLSKMFLFAAQNQTVNGVYNAVGTVHTRQAELTKAIGKALGRPVFLPAVPAFILKLMLGEMAGIVLEGSRVSNQKIKATGFKLEYEDLDVALRDLLGRK
jgi:uncharacterized protein